MWPQAQTKPEKAGHKMENPMDWGKIPPMMNWQSLSVLPTLPILCHDPVRLRDLPGDPCLSLLSHPVFQWSRADLSVIVWIHRKGKK